MARITVLGIGNILLRDEGVGVRLLEAVQAARPWPAEVEFIDGGAGGLNLITVLEAAERLVVFDAAEMDLPAGEFRVISPGQVSKTPDEHRTSLHDVPFLETLELVGRFFHEPASVVILAIQPAVVDHGRDLTPQLQAALPALTEAACRLVEEQHAAA